MQLAPLDERVGDPLDRVAVRLDQVVGRQVRLAEQLLDHRALARIVQHRRLHLARSPVRLTICVPIRWKRFITRSRASSSDSSSQRSSTNSGAIAARTDHPGGPVGRGLDVAADAGRVLAVEDALGRHRTERPDQPRHLLAAPGREPLFLLHRHVVAERAAAAANRQPRRLGALQVRVRGDCVAGLVDRDRARLLGDVLDVDRRAGLDRRHRLDEVVPAERLAARSGARSSAPSSRPARSSPASSPSSSARARRGAQAGRARRVRDAAEVELEDVLAVVLRRRPEPDVAAHAARPGQRRVELRRSGRSSRR